MLKRSIIFLFASFLFTPVFAQEGLTLQKAIEAGLRNSFDIQIAKNYQEIADNNASLGNAGMLPSVAGTATTNNSVMNTQQEFATGQSVDRAGAKSGNMGAGVELNWTVFDGFRMFTTYNRLQELESRGELVYRLQVQQVVADITRQYYDVVRLQEEVKVLEEAVKLSDERIRIARDKLELGLGSEYDLNQSQLDQNRDRSLLLQFTNLLNTSRIQLNQLMGLAPVTPVIVTDTVITTRPVNYDEIRKSFLAKNYQLQIAETDSRIAMLELRETRSQRMPRLSLNSGYNFNKSSSEAGLIRSNQSLGFNYGLSLIVPIFNVNRQIKNASIVVENARLESQRLTLQLNAAFETNFRSYESARELAALEEGNLTIAAKNMDIANEKLRLGTISQLEWRDVQVKYVDAKSSYIEAMYNVKATETSLLLFADMLQVQ